MKHQQFVAIKPRAKQRPRHTRTGVTYTPAETRLAEKQIAAAYTGPKFEGPIEMGINFQNDGFTLTIRETEPAESKLRGDLDNLLKLVQDALNKVAYEDDKQIVRLLAAK